MPLTIGYFVGSLSANSINRTLVHGLMELAGDEFVFEEIRIAGLPLYNRDLDDEYPASALALKESIGACDGLLFATPEYNRSMSAALKNALEWGSRPFGQNAFAGIPAGVIGASPGGPGTAMSQQHLRNVLAYLNVPTMGQPEGFIQFKAENFDADGTIRDSATRDFLTTWVDTYTHWIKHFAD